MSRLSRSAVQGRYDAIARVYDRVTLDRVVYGRARRRAVELLQLAPGDTVLDIGCGTGLSLPALRAAVGPSGTVVGVDLSAQMLKQARRRVHREGWKNVELVQADATRLSEATLPVPAATAALFALSLSTMPDPHAVLAATAAALPEGARLAVLDAGVSPASSSPVSAALAPVWRGVFTFAAADPAARTWEHVPQVADDTTLETFHFGFVRVAAGTVRPQGAADTVD